MERIGLEPGTLIGGYRIIAPLGAGAMGTVYRARDADGLEVAIKTLHASVAADPQARQRLQREIRVLSKIRHPGVARVLDAEADGEEMFIVTELIDGPTLEQEIELGGVLDAEDLFNLAEQMYEALTAVHAAGVIHRDLKASNILVSSRGPVLIDFGIAQAVGDARVTRTGLVMGTPAYLAPELVDGEEPSMATDWWSWAAMLAFAATSRPPFGLRPIDAVLARARTGRPDLEGLGDRTKRALLGALQPRAIDRTPPGVVVEQLRKAWQDGDALSDNTGQIPVAAPQRTADGTAIMPTDGISSDSAAAVDAGPLEDDGATMIVSDADTEALVGNEPSPNLREEAHDMVAERLEEPPAPVYTRPILAHRTWTTLAFGLSIMLAAANWPGPMAVIFGVLWLGCRVLGVSYDSLQSRRETRGGVTERDVMMQGVLLPWHLLRAVIGAVPAVLVAGTGVLTTGGVMLWLVDNEKVSWASSSQSLQWITLWSVALIVVLMWFGPLTGLTRLGARVAISKAVPRGWPVAVVWGVSALLILLLWQVVVGDHAPVWSPLPGPPNLAS